MAEEELQQLEQNILAEGCRDAIKAWRGYIVDGHHRYAICEKHGIPYNVQYIPAISKTDAKIWIANNQLGRRNLATAMRVEIARKKAELLGQVGSLRQIATLAGVSKDTVRKYVKMQGNNEATVKTVETFYNDADVQYKNDPVCFRNMLSRTDTIRKMYEFLDERIRVLLDADETSVVGGLLKAQLQEMEGAINV